MSHFSQLDVKNIKFEEGGNLPAGATLGFIQKAIRYFEQQYGSDDEHERAKAPRTPKFDESNVDKGGVEKRLEQALLSAMGKTRKVYENINLEELMESRGLDWFFPPEVSSFCLLCNMFIILDGVARNGPN